MKRAPRRAECGDNRVSIHGAAAAATDERKFAHRVIPKQLQELVFLLRESPGVERSKMGPYWNIGPFSIYSTAGLWRAKKPTLEVVWV